MRLVKDLHNHRIVYYWIDDADIRISPELASLELADEWRQQYLHETFQGWNRRTSHIDRRRYQHKRNKQATERGGLHLISSGRRRADRVAKVDLDWAKDKLCALFAEYQPEQSDAASLPADPIKQSGTA